MWEEAKETADLVLGVADCANKKGHAYNTGIHNLKGKTMLDLLPGRKLEGLQLYAQGSASVFRMRFASRTVLTFTVM